jgi:hypothetical protein
MPVWKIKMDVSMDWIVLSCLVLMRPPPDRLQERPGLGSSTLTMGPIAILIG